MMTPSLDTECQVGGVTRGIIPKVLYGCERPAMLSEKFCMGVRDPRCNPKSSIAQKKTHGHVYHLDLDLSGRSRD